jgi:hypothetical protein
MIEKNDFAAFQVHAARNEFGMLRDEKMTFARFSHS